MTNQYREFLRLLPQKRRVYVEVVRVRSDGRSLVRTPEGREFRVQGSGIPVGSFAFVEGDEIIGPAPTLALTEFSV